MAEHKCFQEERITELDKNLSLSINTIQSDIKYIRETIDAIHTQTLKTNGRVTKLESETIPKLVKDEIQPLKDWRNILIGAWIIVGGILIGSWGILLNYVNNIITK